MKTPVIILFALGLFISTRFTSCISNLQSPVVVVDSSVSYFKDIVPLIAANCITCHTERGPGPIRLDNYADVSYNAKTIKYVINHHIMPPWLEDGHGWDFSNKRLLSDKDIATFTRWIEHGRYKGDSIVQLAYTPDYIITKPDLILKAPALFVIKSSNHDTTINTSIHFEIDLAMPVAAIEFVPKHFKVTHHASFQIRKDGYYEYDGAVPTSTDFYSDASLVMAGVWAPGRGGMKYPDNFGFTIPKKGIVDVQVHYGATPVDVEDSVIIYIYKAKKPIERNLSLTVIDITDSLAKLSPPEFVINADEKKKFTLTRVLEKDMTVISVFAHMHTLGQNFKVTVTPPEGGTPLPILNIKKWNYRWQEQYYCKKFQHLKKGSLITIVCEYDNTCDNPINPSNPPRITRNGWMATEEMLTFILFGCDYKKGDENREWSKLSEL